MLNGKFGNSLAGQKILITGHTGFTGAWAVIWLKSLGAEVSGFALEPDSKPNLFTEAGISKLCDSHIGDITKLSEIQRVVDQVKPSLILHLAAQPLVRKSYANPTETFDINVMGTANVLEAARRSNRVKGVLCITTDKVYSNKEWRWPYRENDELGGHDPYSASKAAAEILIKSYKSSFGSTDFRVGVARGGNIIGGGDWSEDRLLPDFVRARLSDSSLTLRSPSATRPWQHVLSLVHGYILILESLLGESWEHLSLATWNFGPTDGCQLTVSDVVQRFQDNWPGLDAIFSPSNLHEAHSLAVDSSLARQELGWTPCFDSEKAIAIAVNWYKDFHEGKQTAFDLCRRDIDEYMNMFRT